MKNNDITDLFPYLHENNLRELKTAQKQVRKGLKVDGKVVDGFYFHGDGNIYFRKSDSDDRIQYRNTEAEHAATQGAAYRAYFDDETPIPADLKDLENLLVRAQQAEKREKDAAQLRGVTNPNALPAYEEDEDTLEEGTGEPGETSVSAEDLAKKLADVDGKMKRRGGKPAEGNA